MPCYPATQLYDGSRPDYTNLSTFTVTDGALTEVTATGLEPGQSIPLLVVNPDGTTTPYEIDGQPVVLTYENPTVLVEDGNTYRLDTSGVAGDEDISVTTSYVRSNAMTSVVAKYTPLGGGETIPVEIVRLSHDSQPLVFNLGTGEQILNPIGQFDCCAGGEDQDRFLDAQTISVVGQTEVTVPDNGSISAQNLTGAVARFSYDKTNWFELANRAYMATDAEIATVTFEIPADFVATETNTGIAVARFAPIN